MVQKLKKPADPDSLTSLDYKSGWKELNEIHLRLFHFLVKKKYFYFLPQYKNQPSEIKTLPHFETTVD